MFASRKFTQLCKYILHNNYNDFKSFIKKQRIDLENMVDKDGDTLLHITCMYGNDIITRYLLKNGLSLFIENNSKFSPINFLLLFAEENRYINQCKVRDILNIVKPYMDQQKAFYNDQTNIYTKFTMIYGELKATEYIDSDSSSDFSANSSSSEQEKEKIDEWNNKLFNDLFDSEYDHQYYESFSEPVNKVSYDDWAENIRNSYYSKHRNLYSSNCSKNEFFFKKSGFNSNYTHGNYKSKRKWFSQEIPRISPSKIRKFNENQKQEFVKNHEKAMIKHEILCEKFFNNSANCEIFYDDVPWPFERNISLKDFLFGSLTKDSNEYKAVLKRNRVRWHIDRFMHRVGHRLYEQHKIKIVNKVTEISQILNNLIAE